MTKQNSKHNCGHILGTLGMNRVPHRPWTHLEPAGGNSVGRMARTATNCSVLRAARIHPLRGFFQDLPSTRRDALHTSHTNFSLASESLRHTHEDHRQASANGHCTAETALNSGSGRRRQECERVSNKPQSWVSANKQTNKQEKKNYTCIYKGGGLNKGLY